MRKSIKTGFSPLVIAAVVILLWGGSAQAAFIGVFDPGNWNTASFNSNGYSVIDTEYAYIRGSNNGNRFGGFEGLYIFAPDKYQISFDWEYELIGWVVFTKDNIWGNGNLLISNFQATAVPEPSTLLLLGSGLLGLGLIGRRKTWE